MASPSEEGVVQKALLSLRQSRRGSTTVMTTACSEIDVLVADFAKSEVKVLQSSLDKAWSNYPETSYRYKVLQGDNSSKILEAGRQYASQEMRKCMYDEIIEHHLIAAATHFNERVLQELTNSRLASPTKSTRSVSSRALSKLSEASARRLKVKVAAAKAAMVEKQIEQKRRRSLEIEVKRLEFETKQEFEVTQQLELAKLEADQDVAEAKEKTEMAELEALLSTLMLVQSTNLTPLVPLRHFRQENSHKLVLFPLKPCRFTRLQLHPRRFASFPPRPLKYPHSQPSPCKFPWCQRSQPCHPRSPRYLHCLRELRRFQPHSC